MNRSIEMTVKRRLLRCRFFDGHNTLVVAVSTGVDSMVLLNVLQVLLDASQIIVAHVNHHLRKQSEEEEQYIRNYCQKHHLKLYVDSWTNHPDTGIEAAARKERYRFFKRVVADTQSHFLLTAHHENDLAETILMKLVRGGNIDELIGIYDCREFDEGVHLVRPLLAISKNQLRSYAEENDIKWYEDITNHDDNVERNRFRHHYIPELLNENPRFIDHLADYRDQLISLFKIRDSAVEHYRDKALENEKLNLREFSSIPISIQRPLLIKWFNQNGVYGISFNQITEIIQWLANGGQPSSSFQLKENKRLKKDYEQVTLEKNKTFLVNQNNSQKTMVKFGHWYDCPKALQVCVDDIDDGQHKIIASFWLKNSQLPLRIRQWKSGDYLRLKSGGHQSVQRLLINKKVSRDLRQNYPVITDSNDDVLVVPGLKSSWLDREALKGQQYQKVFIYQRQRTGEK